MPKLKNWKKRIDKRPELLAPGETCVAAFLVHKYGSLSRMAGGAAFGVVGAVAAAASADKVAAGDLAQAGIASRFPFPDTSGVYLVITDRRVAVFGQAAVKGTPTDFVGELALTDIAGASVEKRKMANTFVLEFSDSTTLSFDVAKMTKVEPFDEALRSARGG